MKRCPLTVNGNSIHRDVFYTSNCNLINTHTHTPVNQWFPNGVPQQLGNLSGSLVMAEKLPKAQNVYHCYFSLYVVAIGEG